MQLTNKTNLPKPFYDAILHSRDSYAGNGETKFCSVTDLLKPAHLLALQRKHADEIEEDVSDFFNSFIGTAVHTYIANAVQHKSGVLSEQRLSTNIEGRVVTGGIDYYEDGVLSDFKTTSVWKYVYMQTPNNSTYEDWKWQLNCYALMMREAGFPIKRLKIDCFFTDWKKYDSMKGGDYPPAKLIEIDFPILQDDFIWSWMLGKIKAIEVAEMGLGEVCSPSERWQSETKYAVMKTGRKSALRLLPSLEQAEVYMADQKGPGHYIQTRLGERKRCADYCNVSQFCEDYQEYISAGEGQGENDGE